MGLKQNGYLPGNPIWLSGGGVFALCRCRRPGDGSLHSPFVGAFGQTTGMPAGYRPPGAYVVAIKDGGISSFTTAGSSTTTAAVNAYGVMSATANGAASTSMTAFVTASRQATASGVASTAVTIRANGNIRADLSIGATPSATDIAQAVVGGVNLVGNLNLRQLQRLFAAVLLGESTGGNTTFKDATNDAVTRVAGTVDGSGNRTSVTLTPGD